jgi:FkbM family methyltransferase
VKGLGILIRLIADRFENQPITLEKDVLGSRMRLRTDDLIGRALIFAPNYWDRRERKIIKRIINTGDYVVDIGANIGWYTLFLAKLVGPLGQVDAIEAEQANADELRHNVAINSARQVTIHQVGVSDKNETLALMLNTTGNAGGHSFYDQSHIPNPVIQKISCVPLSTITAGRRARFMKLDIEGFEHRVLRQFFQETPKDAWPEYLMVEDNPGRREEDAIKLCAEHGYEIFDVADTNIFLSSNHR